MKIRVVVSVLVMLVVGLVVGSLAMTSALQSRRERQLAAITAPFVGVTVDGKPIPGLFEIRATGVSTESVMTAAESFLDTLTDAQRVATHYPVDSSEWRDWHNVHRAPREGVRFGEMNASQQERAMGLLAASLSAKGLEKTKNAMRLNEHLAELVGKHDEYGEEFYFITVMGKPSATEPWGWQLDGHHLAINYFVLGDQIVVSPSFMGAEPVVGIGRLHGRRGDARRARQGISFHGIARRCTTGEGQARKRKDSWRRVGASIQRQSHAGLRGNPGE